MYAAHVEVAQMGEWTTEGTPLVLTCGCHTTGVPHMIFQVGSTMVCANHADRDSAAAAKLAYAGGRK